jgi:hypothetical protein
MSYDDRRAAPWHPSTRTTVPNLQSRGPSYEMTRPNTGRVAVGRTAEAGGGFADDAGYDFNTAGRAPFYGRVVPGSRSGNQLAQGGAVRHRYLGRVGRVGDANVDIIPASIAGSITALSKAFNSDGSPSDPRVIDLQNAYTRAMNGDLTGVTYLQTWLNDVPPHPAYSNTLAQQLLTQLAAAGRAGGAAPAGTLYGTSAPGQYTGGAATATLLGVPLVPALLIGGIIYLVTRKDGGGRRAQRGFPAPLENPRRRRRARVNPRRRRSRSRR